LSAPNVGTVETGARVRSAEPGTAESPFRQALARFRRHRLAMTGVVVIAVLVVAALVVSDPAAYNLDLFHGHQPPSAGHWLGTDAIGRDVFARTLLGGRVSLMVGLVSALFSTIIGLVVGSLAGYYRRLDFVIMRFVDVIMSFPLWILLLLAAAFVGPGIINIIILIGVITWPIPTRIIRGQFLQLRESDFVIAAKVLGVRDRTIVLRHVIPNAMAPLLVYASIAVAGNVLLEAAMSYLGLGVQVPTPSWGNLLNNARSISVLSREPWQWAPAAILIVVFVLAVNFVGDGIRDAADPRGRSRR
jgi:peptide/nickel transport system permease protein